ncbi:V-type ATP synthase subunit E [Treponema sp. R80B11-R83G3]
MEIQVQELIDRIKKDGIKAATEEANKVKAEADTEARRIVETAKKEADELLERAKQDAARSEKAGIAALEQASRNLILAFKDEVQALLNKIINEKVSANYNEDVLKTALPELIKSWADKSGTDLAVILPESELSKLQGYFNDRLREELSKGVELKSNRKLACGFHISNKEGSVYYDFSSEAVAKQLSAYLNPKLAELLKK